MSRSAHAPFRARRLIGTAPAAAAAIADGQGLGSPRGSPPRIELRPGYVEAFLLSRLLALERGDAGMCLFDRLDQVARPRERSRSIARPRPSDSRGTVSRLATAKHERIAIAYHGSSPRSSTTMSPRKKKKVPATRARRPTGARIKKVSAVMRQLGGASPTAPMLDHDARFEEVVALVEAARGRA